MSQKLNETLSAIDACLTELHTKISSLQEKHPNYELFANSSNFPRDANAKTNLTLAFALNSLYFSTLRMNHTNRPQEVKQHPVHAQIKIVRDHYVKFDNVVNRRKQKEGDKEQKPITRIVERTVNENQRIIKEQQGELSNAKKKAESSSSESSSEESESESEEVKIPVIKPSSRATQPISSEKPKAKMSSKSQVAMHGATVVPVPAYLRNKQLLEKLKK